MPHGSMMGIWQLTESVGELPHPKCVSTNDLHSEMRIRERLVSHELVRRLTGMENFQIGHESSGRPVLDGWNISISHTRGWAVVILSKEASVAVDVEYVSERVNRVADRFIRPDEPFSNQDELSEDNEKSSLLGRLINWCAKETAYKFYSEEDLQYFEMRLLPFRPQSQGFVVVEDLKVPKHLEVNYETNAEFVLTWAVG